MIFVCSNAVSVKTKIAIHLLIKNNYYLVKKLRSYYHNNSSIKITKNTNNYEILIQKGVTGIFFP